MNLSTLLQTILLLYVLLTVTCTGSSLTHDEECSALFQFKQSMIHQDDELCAAHAFQIFQSWKPTSNASDVGVDCCSWYGVECNNDYEIIGLDLKESFLCGHINSSSTLFSLVHLQKLNLSVNDFYESKIPYEITHLKQLRSLNLSDSGFSGQIPNGISQLMYLSSLDLSMNSLNLYNSTLKNLLQNLTRLEELNLSLVDISSFVPHILANFSSLRSIILKDCSLSNEFPVSIFKLPKLALLHVPSNANLTGSLPEFNNGSLLQHLDLGMTGFSGILPDSISNLNHLTVLRLSKCYFSGHIPGSLSSLTQLTILGLSGNEFTGLVRSLASLSKLGILGLSYSKFEKGRLPNWIDKLTKISQLYLSNMNIEGDIPPSICELKSLQVLDLSSNNMSGTLPPCLGRLSNSLVVLNLRQNHFHGIMMHEFLQGCLLEEINLSKNKFMGQLPRSLKNCTNLEFLSLGDNSFHDVFPSWLGTVANLQVLILRSNNFYGPIHALTMVRSQFPKLRIIDLSINGFSGRFHQNYFQTWNAMKVVGKLSVMQSVINTRTSMSMVSYTMTLIHKGVRTEYEKILTIFTAIDLSCNHFEGEIPLSIQDLQGLESLNLSYNHFTGRVLPSLRYLVNLESLDLSQNELSGEIPQQLVQLNFLGIFNVSSNHLDGQIPQGQQFNTFENNSYMGNPRLCGKPLSNKCSRTSRIPPTTNTSKSFLPSENIDWIIIFCGVASGLVVGIVNGNSLHIKYIK